MLMAGRYIARLKSVCGIGILGNTWSPPQVMRRSIRQYRSIGRSLKTLSIPLLATPSFTITGNHSVLTMLRAPASAGVASPSGKGVVQRFR